MRLRVRLRRFLWVSAAYLFSLLCCVVLLFLFCLSYKNFIQLKRNKIYQFGSVNCCFINICSIYLIFISDLLSKLDTVEDIALFPFLILHICHRMLLCIAVNCGLEPRSGLIKVHKLVYVASPLNVQHKGERAKNKGSESRSQV